MKTRQFFPTLIVSLVFIAFIAFVVGNVSGAGIVVVDGWSHGVALCGEVDGANPVTETSAATLWSNEHGDLFTVNAGHMSDPEVQELIRLTEQECSQYRE